MIVRSAVQEKTSDSMTLKCESGSNETDTRNWHEAKDRAPRTSTPRGIQISISPEQKKAIDSITRNLELAGKSIDRKREFAKQLGPSTSISSGMSIVVDEEKERTTV
jgi:hypothetical protein